MASAASSFASRGPVELLARCVADLERRLDVAALGADDERLAIANEAWRLQRHAARLSLSRRGPTLIRLRGELRRIAREAVPEAELEEPEAPP